MSCLCPSRYNFTVTGASGETAAFNTLTGALIRLQGCDVGPLSRALLDVSLRFSGDEFPNSLSHQLQRGGFLVDSMADELGIVRERYWRARGDTPAVLTLTTTMDCNLACYYCYEQRSTRHLSVDDVESIVKLATQLVESSKSRTLHVDWYGGEPLLNHAFIELASEALQTYCSQHDVPYVASVISNGSHWPEDVEAFVSRNRIRQVQISFDGMQANHDKRRRYRKGYGKKGDSSFEHAVALVDRLVQCARVDLRFNIDRKNAPDLLPFIGFAKDRGWFGARYPAVFQPARLAAYSDASQFMRDYELTIEEFDTWRARVREELGAGRIEESEVPDGYPHPKTSVCAALAQNSVVVGADRHTYRCGLQVGEIKRAVGKLDIATEPEMPGDSSWWASFDPTRAPSCSRCSFLPICWGGCPKKHLEGDQHALREQGMYWRNNLPRLILKAAGLGGDRDSFPETLQFR
jgi:uncharacterized protein